MSTPEDIPMPVGPDGQPLSAEELRAAYDAQLKELRVEDVVVQSLVSLNNLAGRKAGLAPGTEDERDPEQLRMAIDGARGLLALVEPQLGPDGASLKDALSQLQMAYVQLGGTQPEAAPAQPGGGGQEPPSRLWVPGQ
ncbi:MAG: hypothetical protein ACEQSX_17990 [Baekduiaceae bacterium]